MSYSIWPSHYHLFLQHVQTVIIISLFNTSKLSEPDELFRKDKSTMCYIAFFLTVLLFLVISYLVAAFWELIIAWVLVSMFSLCFTTLLYRVYSGWTESPETEGIDVRGNNYWIIELWYALKISLCQKDLLLLLSFLHYALAAAQCIVINPVCGCMGVYMGGSVTTINNTKLHASILTKLGLWVKVVTISSWLNFGRPAPPGRGLRQGENFWLRLTTASAQCLHLIWALFHFVFFPAQFFLGWFHLGSSLQSFPNQQCWIFYRQYALPVTQTAW